MMSIMMLSSIADLASNTSPKSTVVQAVSILDDATNIANRFLPEKSSFFPCIWKWDHTSDKSLSRER